MLHVSILLAYILEFKFVMTMLETFAEFIQAVVLIQATKRLHVCVHRYFVIAEEIM